MLELVKLAANNMGMEYSTGIPPKEQEAATMHTVCEGGGGRLCD